jgi:hypothetical protein
MRRLALWAAAVVWDKVSSVLRALFCRGASDEIV